MTQLKKTKRAKHPKPPAPPHQTKSKPAATAPALPPLTAPPADPSHPLLDLERRFPQARARATYQSLLAAAQSVFSQKGFEETATQDIAAAAGVSVGTFYRYFEDKWQIFTEMIRILLARGYADVTGLLTPYHFSTDDHRTAIAAAIALLFESTEKFPALERGILEMSRSNEEVATIRESYEALGHEALTRIIATQVSRSLVPDPRAAAHIIELVAVEAAVAQAGERAGRRGISAIDARDALVEMIHRYLFPGESGAVAKMTTVARAPRRSQKKGRR